MLPSTPLETQWLSGRVASDGQGIAFGSERDLPSMEQAGNEHVAHEFRPERALAMID